MPTLRALLCRRGNPARRRAHLNQRGSGLHGPRRGRVSFTSLDTGFPRSAQGSLARHRVPSLGTGFPRSAAGQPARCTNGARAGRCRAGSHARALTRWVRAAARWRQRRGGPSASAAVQGRDWAWQQSFGRVCALQFANIPSVGTEPDRGSASLVGFVASAQRRVANPCCPPCRPPCASSSSLF